MSTAVNTICFQELVTHQECTKLTDDCQSMKVSALTRRAFWVDSQSLLAHVQCRFMRFLVFLSLKRRRGNAE